VRPTTLPLAVLAAGAAGLAYSAWEARAYTLRRFVLPVLPAGSAPLRALHLSDLHLVPRQRHKLDWVRSLAELEPDLVVSTGDNLAHVAAVPAVLEAHGDLLSRPGVFVLGSNDYWGPRAKNPARYLMRAGSRRRIIGERLPTADLVDGFRAAGWLDLTNRRGSLTLRGSRLDFVGVDDPHLRLDRYDRVAGPADPSAALTVGVMHAPYRRVLDAMAADGVGALLAGHTHGGQLCVPGAGALVTNCDLPRAQARGVSRWPAAPSGPGVDPRPWLHVSAGVGTNPYTPVRFACRPEASLLTLVPTAAADVPAAATVDALDAPVGAR
jgi:predicted MPP superfamily phosphohydrolase